MKGRKVAGLIGDLVPVEAAFSLKQLIEGLGGKVECPTPDGPVSVTVPKGSNSGQIMRLRGKGAYAGGGRGDLKARLMVMLPETTDPILLRVAEDWRSSRPYKPGKA